MEIRLQETILVSLVVKHVKVFSEEAFVVTQDTVAVIQETAQWKSIPEIAANIVDFRNVCKWE